MGVCENNQNYVLLSKFSKIDKTLKKNLTFVKNCQNSSKVVKTVKNCQNCYKLSKLSKIVKNCQNFKDWQKMSKFFKIVSVGNCKFFPKYRTFQKYSKSKLSKIIKKNCQIVKIEEKSSNFYQVMFPHHSDQMSQRS